MMGTILEAETTGNSTGLGGLTIKGQSIGSALRTVTATITLQGDLISVKDGQVVESVRAVGSQSDHSVGAEVATEWGSLNTDRDATSNAPPARALREAVGKLVREISAKLRP
jgi:hypothetical protein